jgi:Tfp pilus assembly protein PilO
VSRIAGLRTELEAARSAVPDEENTEGFVNLINDTGARTGVHVRSLVADQLVERDLYTEAPFKLRVDGTYYAIAEFFDRLMRGQRLLSVSNLALGSPARGSLGSYTVSPSETVGASCLVTSYFNSAPAAPPAKKAGH